MKNPKSMNIMIGGEAGQGLVTIGGILIKALVRSGFHIVVKQDYQSRIRGGHNTFAIRISPQPIEAPAEDIDLLLALNAETIDLHMKSLSGNALLVADPEITPDDPNVLPVPWKEISEGGHINIAALGVVASVLKLDRDVTATAMNDFFGAKHPELATENRDLLVRAMSWASERTIPFTPPISPETISRKMVINGNEAIALGAISAGLKILSYYPMTPATSIAMTIINHADEAGITVEQAEDEISAINMAIGASFAGKPAMVCTSGGGFALMTEGISLAGITETPVVIAISQRPGPATGLPTRTEQGDLEFVLHGGHGEFPRAIYAPGSVEQCYNLTRQAFQIADEFQSPVFVLTDQFLADSYRGVDPADIDEKEPVCGDMAPADGITAPYHRYAITESGVSPRLFPGRTKHLVITDSDEHTPDGHLTEDLAVRIVMQDKRMRKETGLKNVAIPPQVVGDASPDILLVCWGSTRGSVCEAVEGLRENGTRAAVLHFAQVWPLRTEAFLPVLESAKRVIGVEGNGTGQFCRLIRRETGFHINETVLRYDGLPVTAGYILQKIDNRQ